MSKEQRERLIGDVSSAILVDRAATHGSPEDSFGVIAGFWTTYLSGKLASPDTEVTPRDVAIMMALLKVARSAGNPQHLDNYVDGAGYMLLAGEAYV